MNNNYKVLYKAKDAPSNLQYLKIKRQITILPSTPLKKKKKFYS